MKRDGCSGGILLAVMGILVALGIVVALLGAYALERSLLAEVRGAEADNPVGNKLSGSIEAAMAVLASFEEVAGGLSAPAEGWARPAELLGGWPEELADVEVEVFDESSRPGLALLDPEGLRAVLAEAGLSRGKATELSDLFFDWTDEDNDERMQGRENDSFTKSDDPWVANRSPETWEEIWTIPEWAEEVFDEDGRPKEWARHLAESFSLENDGPANINTIDPAVADWLYEADVIPYPRWLDRRLGPDREAGTDDDRLLSGEDGTGEGGSPYLASESRLLRIRASLRAGDKFVWKEVWVSRGGNGGGRAREDNEPDNQGAEARRGRGGGGSGAGNSFSPWGNWRITDIREGLSLVLEEGEKVE